MQSNVLVCGLPWVYCTQATTVVGGVIDVNFKAPGKSRDDFVRAKSYCEANYGKNSFKASRRFANAPFFLDRQPRAATDAPE